MLGLKMATDPRWVNIAEKSIEEILTDHAFCEQKAASSGISLIVRYPERSEMVEEVTAVVAEEWGHFRKVLKELNKRGHSLGPQRKDAYVGALLKVKKHSNDRDKNLVEDLLVCAMIEARSCERFRLLSLHISDPALKSFYHEFMVSEAGHYRMFLDLACKYRPEAEVRARWQEFLEAEAAILAAMELRGDRMH